MSGSIKVGGHTVFVHTGASGAGTLSVQGQNGNVLLSDDGTAVSLGNNVRLPASGGIQDSSGNNILTESGGNVSLGDIRLSSGSALKDSSGNDIIDSNGTLLSSKILSVNWFPRNSINTAFVTNSYQALGTENAITPSNSSNRVLIQATIYLFTNNNNTNINYNRHYFGFYKGDYTTGQSVSVIAADVIFGFGAFQQNYYDAPNDGYMSTNLVIQWLDSPNSTSEQKYGIATKKHDDNDGRIYIYGFDMVIWELL